MNIAILGYGTVGRGVDSIITSSVPTVEVTRILERPGMLSDPRMTSSFDDICNDESLELVVECIGGIEPAHSFIAQALARGKHVVTSNKAVVAEYLAEFVEISQSSGARFFIEASVGGGIPWIASLEKARRVEPIKRFSGIMNGTTNYIVYKMMQEGAEFSEVLAAAQDLGYAEADPSADIDGFDVRNKTLISATLAFDVACTPEIPTTGIRTLTAADLALFATKGLTIKLLGRGVCEEGRYAVAVEPVALSQHSLEAQVPNNFNLISLEGDSIGELKFYGQGAGSLPTGNAIVQDILDCVAGRTPRYVLDQQVVYDPELLVSDYVFRTSAELPEAEDFAGAHLVRGLSAQAARTLFETCLATDPTSFMAALDAPAC